MACLGYIWDEFLALGKLALPTLAINGLEISMSVIDLISLGHLDKESLAIGALGTVYYNMIWYFSEGVLSAQDSLVSHAFGMKDYVAARHWSYVSAIVIGILSIFGTILFLLSPFIVTSLFELGGGLGESTSVYIFTLIPALWGQTFFRIIQKYFNCQHIIAPVIVSMIIGLASKLFFNFLLLSVVKTGYIGAAISTSITRGVMFLVIFLWLSSREGYLIMRNEFLILLAQESQDFYHNWMNSNNSHEMSPVSTSKNSTVEMTALNKIKDEEDELDEGDTDALIQHRLGHGDKIPNEALDSYSQVGSWKNQLQIDCLRFLALGFPGAIVLMIEMWSYEIAILVMSQIGPVSVSTQQILICWTNVTFIFIPLSLSIAATTRISQLLVSQNPVAAKSSALISIVGTLILVTISGYILYETRFLLGYLFTSDVDIISRVRQLAPLVALFQIINGLQGITQGIMRGMNRHNELVAYSFLSYWIIAMPFGLYLTFYTRPRTGVKGLWYGFITGLSMLSIVLLAIILTTDWEREVRRARIRVEKYQNHYETFQTSPMTGGRSLGGFLLLGSTGDEELDDVERIEIQLEEDEEEKTK